MGAPHGEKKLYATRLPEEAVFLQASLDPRRNCPFIYPGKFRLPTLAGPCACLVVPASHPCTWVSVEDPGEGCKGVLGWHPKGSHCKLDVRSEKQGEAYQPSLKEAMAVDIWWGPGAYVDAQPR